MTDPVLEAGTRQKLTDGWELLGTTPSAVDDPGDLPVDGWTPAVVPGTVAVSVGPDDPWAHDDYDARDWWYRYEFPALAHVAGRQTLCFDGLATLARVWLNGESVLESDNMFRRYRVDVTEHIQEHNTLVIVFRSLGARLAERHSRPRWKTALVKEQDLRWYRTTLMGRMPGWTPPITTVGPWRDVELQVKASVSTRDLRVRTHVDAQLRRSVHVEGLLESDQPIHRARLRVADDTFELQHVPSEHGARFETAVPVGDVPLWWPHTHGDPMCIPLSLDVETDGGEISVPLGRRGFRHIAVDREAGGIRYVVNNVKIFCRGACWTPTDTATLDGTRQALRAVLERFAAAHGNMIRVGGTMTYESDAFFEICDELGIMVWQDFMYANMDYPVDDDGFRAGAIAEARQEVARLGTHPSVVTWCGGSEVEQQAAMFGAPREIWSNELFSTLLPGIVDELHPGTPYWPSTPTGGALPFHVGEGLAHYYGVGAYLRPLDDVRLSHVRFTPETLGFSNVPEPEVVNAMTAEGPVPPHHPAWKRGVPRDSSAGWDFEDVRDHYLERTHDIHAMRLRYEDLERYWSLSRTVPGHLMERAFREWRAESSGCGGALVWFLQDLVPGAGWGLLDHRGLPKATYYYLKRAWAPRQLSLLDRGLDGVSGWLTNELDEATEGILRVRVVDRGDIVTAEAEQSVAVPPRTTTSFSVDELLGHFMDLTHSYRFGPGKHEAVIAEWTDPRGRLIADDCLVVDHTRTGTAEIRAKVEAMESEPHDLLLTLESGTLVHDLRIDLRHHLADDNYLALHPGRKRSIRLRWRGTQGSFRGSLEAFNLDMPVRLTAPS
ncbi:MAG: glycoside hydrolase family 2 protein [Dehalococcoidia bacterium]